ncbi:hypothetical protein QJQ45_027356 [Haematococcus lacustris]|nr:hypothetical protein QJQ45_027356 [Haematococcus lacustris]
MDACQAEHLNAHMPHEQSEENIWILTRISFARSGLIQTFRHGLVILDAALCPSAHAYIFCSTGGPGPDEDAAQVAARLNQMLRPATITGQELRDMVVEKVQGCGRRGAGLRASGSNPDSADHSAAFQPASLLTLTCDSSLALGGVQGKGSRHEAQQWHPPAAAGSSLAQGAQQACLRPRLQVMWKFLEQKSFPLSEEQFMQQLDAVAEYITEWGVAATVRHGIANANPRGPGYTGGTSARCISIPLDVDLSAARRGEWS